jgi:hypothetical protein
MFFLILLSVLQICFIPGFIVFVFLNRKPDDTKVLLAPVISFGLSLIINYLIVLFLSYFHLYTRSALIIVFITEVIFLVCYFFFFKPDTDVYNVKRIFREILSEAKFFIDFRKSFYDKVKSVLFILSLLLLTALSLMLILNTGKIFHTWDAVFSWNRWAIDFYNNGIPSSTYHYPLLIPANWSVSYVLCGYPLQFIPKAIMPLFYSFIILGIKQRSIAFISTVFFLFLGFNLLNWTDGFVDVPVAFFSILVFICLVLINKDDTENDKKKYILLSTILVCGSAVTKQAGIFLVLIYPLLLFILTKHKFVWTSRKIIKSCLLFLLFIVVIIIPYYIYAEIAIKKGFAASEIPYVTNEIYNGASWFERLINAGKIFSNVFNSRILFIICIYPFLLSFTRHTFRLLNISLVLPYALIWALFFSYDLRNSAIIIPYFCLGIGVGLEIILKRLQKTTVNEAPEH